MRPFRFLAVALLLLSSIAAFAIENPYTWKMSLKEKSAKPGDVIHVKATATIEPTWHIYSTKDYGEDGPLPTSFKVGPSPLFQLDGKVKQPPPKTKHDESFNITAEYYEGSATFIVPVKVGASAQPGKQKVKVSVNAMACDDHQCMPPKETTAEFDVTILKGISDVVPAPTDSPSPGTPVPSAVQPSASPSNGAATNGSAVSAAPANAAGAAPAGSVTVAAQAADSSIEGAKAKGFWWFMGFAFTMGLVALLTPCVFPMVPLTVSFFTKRAAASHRSGLIDAGLYGLGIVLTFTLLGFLVSVAFGATSLANFAASASVNFVYAFVFLVLALNLFGVYEFRIPTGLVNRLNMQAGAGSKRTGILLMGLVFTITSFTCTVPFVGSVMVAAARGEFLWPLAGMVAYSAAFALPFVLLAMFPHALKKMPKSGDWMTTVKVVMGFLELAAVIKFLSNADIQWNLQLLTRDVFLSSWIAISAVLAVYLLGLVRFHHDPADVRIGTGRLLLAISFITIALFFYSGINGVPLGTVDAYLPLREYGIEERLNTTPITKDQALVPEARASRGRPAASSLVWMDDYRSALAKAEQEHKNVFIDFTGFTCTNCRWMESNVFTRPIVDSLLSKYVLVRLYTDGNGAQYTENQQLEERQFGTVALPFYAVVNHKGETVSVFAKGMTRDIAEFTTFLQAGIGPMVAGL